MSMAGGIAACNNKGAGWHLPTATELNILCVNAALIGNFPLDGYPYWSSTGTPLNCDTLGSVGTSGCNINASRGSCYSGPIRCVKSI